MSKDESTGSAIAARREQVKAFERPEVLSGVDIKQAVQSVRETNDTFKVYVKEWLMVFASIAPVKAGGEQEVLDRFEEKYAGRVRDEDVRLEPSSSVSPDDYSMRLMLRLPNVKGEFKTRALASAYVDEQGFEDASIVSRNSRDEHVLKDYSIKKLLVKKQ
jgi:hypothetical protein